MDDPGMLNDGCPQTGITPTKSDGKSPEPSTDIQQSLGTAQR
jgi:hypothetical protein